MILSFDNFFGPEKQYQIGYDYTQGDECTSVNTETDLHDDLQIYDLPHDEMLYMTLEEFLNLIK